MTRIFDRSAGATAFCVAFASIVTWASAADACDRQPDLHIEVTTKFDAVPVRSDYTLAAIAELARQQHGDRGRALLGFYTSEFGYTIDLRAAGDPACPAYVDTVVTLRLQHRLIELGQETEANSCVYPGALQHYRHLAEVDEQTVGRFGERTAAMLVQTSRMLKQTFAPRVEDLDAALREQIRGVVDAAIAPLHDARRDAQQAANNAGELRQLASACAI